MRATPLALLLLIVAAPAAAQPRVEAVTSNRCRMSYAHEIEEILEATRGDRWAGTATVPPARAAAVPRWLEREFGLSRDEWGARRRLRGRAQGRVDVTRGGRHVRLRYSTCAGCDCSSEVTLDATYDASGRLTRALRLTETCECVDARFVEHVVTWDGPRVASVRRIIYQHPTCSPDEPPPFSYRTLSLRGGGMPPIVETIEVRPDAAPDRFLCTYAEGTSEPCYTARWAR